VSATLRTEEKRVLLQGRVAIVAGAGPGLGREIALGLAREGADLVLGAPRTEQAASVADEVRALGRRAEAVGLELGDAESCEAIVKTCAEVLGRVDVLVANAADDGGTRPFGDDLDEWRRVMEANLWGMLQVGRAAVPAMASVGGGRIVFLNTAPVWRDQPGRGAHAVATAALVSATRTLAAELGPLGIRVNGVHPGTIWGPAVKARLRALAIERGSTPEALYRELIAESSLGYLPRPAEVAGSVLFLASDLSRPVTGQTLTVDAGHGLTPS
jgi:NAD(P)-dependent dehydrogenase (short-subunit alcohol dehydrogenase family)